MSFNFPLGGSDYTSLRKSTYAGSQYASQLPNTVVFAAQLSASVSSASFAQNAWHNATVGAYTDALVGQLLLISHTNDRTLAYFTGRVRQAFDATNIYFNETSINQTSGDYFWVIDDYPVMDKLIEYDTTNNVYNVDWNVTFHRLKPIIGSADNAIGLKAAYANFIDASTLKYRISLSALFYVGESSGTITSWALNIKDGTLISGSISGSGTTTGTITIDFPAGFRHIIFTVTNSFGITSTLAIKVWAEPRTGSSTLVTGHNGSNISIDVSNPGNLQSCSMEVFSTELGSTLNNTPLCVWDEEYLGGTLGSVGGNVRFVGRLRKENNQAKASTQYVRTLSTAWTLEGPDTQLNRLENFRSMLISNAASPAVWGEINSLTPYNAIWLLLSEFTTFCNSNVLNFDTYDSTFPYVSFQVQGTTMLGIVNDLAQSIDAQMQFSADGRALIARHAFYLTNSQRGLLHTIADWTDSDRTADLSLQTDDIRNVAQVDGWGGEWVGGTNVTPQHAMAPGLARDIGERSLTLTKNILANAGAAASQTELNDRTACHWLKEALAVRLGAPQFPGAGFLVPDVSAWHTWTVAASDNLAGHSYTSSTRWILEKTNQVHDNRAGSKKINNSFRQETNGIGMGKTIAIPDTSDNNLPAPFSPLPIAIDPLSIVVPPITPLGTDVYKMARGLKRMAVVINDGTRWTTTNFNQTNASLNPHWVSASLGVSGAVVQWVADPFSTRYSSSTGKTYGWLITTTGIYYGDLNTPSFSLFFTFRASSTLRSADVDVRRSGHIAVVTDYADGVYATYATTGGNFIAEYSVGVGGGTYPPGCAYSSHVTGQVFTSINGTGKKSVNSGASYSTDTTINPVSDCATEIALPIGGNASDSIKYYVKRGTTWTQSFDFTTGQHGWIPNNPLGDPTDYCNYVFGVGFVAECVVVGNPHMVASCTLELAMPGLTNMSVTYTAVLGDNSAGVFVVYYNANANHDDLGFTVANGTNTANQANTFGRSATAVCLIANVNSNGAACGSSSAIISGATLSGTGTNPFTGVTGGDKLMRVNGTSETDITPGLLPWQSQKQIAISPTNPNLIAVIGANAGFTQYALYVSQNAGTSWTTAIAPSSSNPWRRVWFSGDKNNLLYLGGTNGEVGFSSDLGATIADKLGDISSSGEVMGIAAL